MSLNLSLLFNPHPHPSHITKQWFVSLPLPCSSVTVISIQMENTGWKLRDHHLLQMLHWWWVPLVPLFLCSSGPQPCWCPLSHLSENNQYIYIFWGIIFFKPRHAWTFYYICSQYIALKGEPNHRCKLASKCRTCDCEDSFIFMFHLVVLYITVQSALNTVTYHAQFPF